MNRIVDIDFETFSECNIMKAGAYRYASDPSTIALCMCYLSSDFHLVGKDNDPEEDVPYLWLPGDPYPFEEGDRFAAHNAEFEIYIWTFVMTRLYGWPECPPPEMWIDTAAIARYRGYPGKLEFAAIAMRLTDQKDKEGHRIMMKLSRPRKASVSNPDLRWTPETKPEDFEKLYDYCADDVRAERGILQLFGPLPRQEQELWVQNVKINIRGIPCDSYLAQTVVGMKELHLDAINAELSEITGGEITKTTQTARLTKYLNLPSLDRDFLEHKADAYIRTPKQRKLVDLRLAASKTSTAKFDALLASVCEDERMHGLLMYHAASQTARYGGSLIQPHNMPRPKTKQDALMKIVQLIHSDRPLTEKYRLLYRKYGSGMMQVFSDLVRSSLWAEDGYDFVVVDYANVEARILAWEADEDVLLNEFKAGKSPYLSMAADIYKRPIDKKGDPVEYSLGKACVLGAGFGMAYKKFLIVCHSWGIPIEEKLAKTAIAAYRERYSKIPELWYATNTAILNCVENRTMVEIGKCMWRVLERPQPVLECTLPSGKCMYYPYPDIREMVAPWNPDKIIDQLHYKSWDGRMRKFISIPTYGAMLVENATQAIARELLADLLLRLERRKMPIMLHVHDEALIHVKKSKSQRAYDIMVEEMSNPPEWAKDIPLAAEGYIDERFKKD